MSQKYNYLGAGIGKKPKDLSRSKTKIHQYEGNFLLTAGQTLGVIEANMPDGQKQKARELSLSIGRNIPFLNLPK